MPVAIKLKRFSSNGTNTRTVTDLTVDYADPTQLPELIRVFANDSQVWERTGGQNSTNYRPYQPPTIVDLEVSGKIVDV